MIYKTAQYISRKDPKKQRRKEYIGAIGTQYNHSAFLFYSEFYLPVASHQRKQTTKNGAGRFACFREK